MVNKTAYYCLSVAGGPLRTFADLGVSACTVTTQAGGDDAAVFTVDKTLGTTNAPFVPWARHDLYAPNTSQPAWSGWLMQPAVQATAVRHQQIFRLDGPMTLLAGLPYQQQWAFATLDGSAGVVTTADLSRVILNAGSTGVAAQINAIFAYFQTRLSVGIALGSTSTIPSVKPPEDEQAGLSCAECLKRELRCVPRVTAYWTYGATPTLHFAPPPAAGAYDLTVDATDGTVTEISSVARHDILLRELTVLYVGEAETEPDEDGATRVALTLSPESSFATNGSLREAIYTCRLRGISDLYAAESVPEGLAAALHAPFRELTHTLSWAKVTQDVDWTATPGMVVRALHAGDSLAASRPILQRITRDLRTGTTTYQAGPPAHLDMDDILGLYRQLLGRTRNAARTDGSGGPGEQTYGFKDNSQGSGGTGVGGGEAALPARVWNVIVNGQAAVASFNSTAPTDG